jgi:uncharacterized membrane protein YhfC
MISWVTILYIFISFLVCFSIPIGGYFIIKKKHPGFAGVFIGGALSFYIPQMVIRVPLLQLVLPNMEWYKALSQNVLGIAIFLGLTAALFETFGRSLTLNWLLRKKLSYRSGLIHGLGHGGIEAILFVGLNYGIFFLFALLLNNGIQEPLSFLIPHDQQTLLKSLLNDTESILFLMAGIERALVIPFHMAMSLLITIGIVQQKRRLYTSIVIALHTLLDMSVVIVSSKTQNIYILESLVLLASVIAILLIVKNKHQIQEFPQQDDGEKAVDEGF